MAKVPLCLKIRSWEISIQKITVKMKDQDLG